LSSSPETGNTEMSRASFNNKIVMNPYFMTLITIRYINTSITYVCRRIYVHHVP